MKQKRKYTLLLIAIAAALIVAMSGDTVEAVQVHRGHSLDTAMHPPANVSSILHRGCYNCHSNETRWPWYSHIPPVSWMIHSDVENGRRAMNFSEWSVQSGATPGKAASMLLTGCAAIESRLMPPRPYLLLHPDAGLSQLDRQQFCDWAHTESRQLTAQAH